MAQSMEMRSRSKRNGAARDSVKARANDVMEDFAELRRDMSLLADAAAKSATNEVRHTRERISNLGRSLRERTETGAEYLSERVRERPAAAIGVSLGAGLLIGLLLARR